MECKDCNGGVQVINSQYTCQECGLVVGAVHVLNKWSSYRNAYNPKSHFNSILNRIQGVYSTACSRFNGQYLESLREKLDGDLSLKNIHKNLPNKDQRYLNYIYMQLADRSCWIDWHDRKCLEAMFIRCYRFLYLNNIKVQALSILSVAVDYYELDYIKPFLYTKFKLKNETYQKLYNIWETTRPKAGPGYISKEICTRVYQRIPVPTNQYSYIE